MCESAAVSGEGQQCGEYKGGLAAEKGHRTFGGGHQLYKGSTNSNSSAGTKKTRAAGDLYRKHESQEQRLVLALSSWERHASHRGAKIPILTCRLPPPLYQLALRRRAGAHSHSFYTTTFFK